MEENKTKKTSGIKAIIILAVLLALSIAALIGVLIYRSVSQNQADEVTVPDNIISPSSDGAPPETNQDDKTEKPDDKTEKPDDKTEKPDDKTEKPVDDSDTVPSAESTRDEISTYETKPDVESETQQVVSPEEPKKAAVISLYRNHAEDNKPFKTENMFPGDVETKYYCVKVSHSGDVIVCYHADIRPGYEKLAEVLRCRIVLLTTGKTLYDGLMKDMPQSLDFGIQTDTAIESELYYGITVYLDTAVGNEYQNKDLVADFRWWVKDTGNLEPIPTGDNSHILWWIGISACSLFIVLFLVVKRRKEEDENE